MFAAFAFRADIHAGAHSDIGAVQAREHGDPETRLDGEEHQGPVATALPSGLIRGRDDGVDLGRGQERHDALVAWPSLARLRRRFLTDGRRWSWDLKSVTVQYASYQPEAAVFVLPWKAPNCQPSPAALMLLYKNQEYTCVRPGIPQDRASPIRRSNRTVGRRLGS